MTALYSAATIKDIEGIINHDLRMLVRWAAQWLINFNPLKTEVMLFTLRLVDSLPNIIFDGTPIKFVTEHKHLDLTFSSNGQWHCHIENIIKSASKVIGIMRKLKFTFSRVCIKSNIPIIFTANYWIFMCYMGWLYSARYQLSLKTSEWSCPHSDRLNKIGFIR